METDDNLKNNPFYHIFKYMVIRDERHLRRYSNATGILLSYFCIGIAYLIKLTEVQNWFYELEPLWYIIVHLVCFAIIGSWDPIRSNTKGEYIDYWAALKLIPMILILTLLDDTSFTVLYESLIIAELYSMFFGSCEFSEEFNESIKKRLVIYGFPVLSMFIGMSIEGVIKEGNDPGIAYIGYDTNANWIGLLLVYGYILFTDMFFIKWNGFRTSVMKVSTPEDYDNEETYHNGFKIRSAFLSRPKYYGFYMSILFFLYSHSAKGIDIDEGIDIDGLAPFIKDN